MLQSPLALARSSLQLAELSPSDFPKTFSCIEEAIQEGVAPGFVLGVWSVKYPDHGWTQAWGQRRSIPSVQPMERDTVFDLASVSKVMGTATLATALIDRGWIAWDDPVGRYLPEIASPEIQIQHLAAHTAGYIAWEPLWEKMRQEFGDNLWKVSVRERQAQMRKWVVPRTLDARPGERVLYSDLSFLNLGFLLEEVCGSPLDQAVEEWVFRPMGLKSATYHRVTSSATDGLLSDVAATENCSWRGAVLQGQVHDDNCWTMGGYAGHAGVFATIEDVLRFSRHWLTGYFSWPVTHSAWSEVLPPVGPLGVRRSRGWDMPSGETAAAGPYFSGASVGHLGFTGTSLWLDPVQGLAVSLLSNRVHPSRENVLIRSFRPKLHRIFVEEFRDWISK